MDGEFSEGGIVMTELHTKPIKPLGGKAYGSIGHLPCSRIGPGDHFVHEGQQKICTEKPRKGDRIIVTEKLDGACMSVANINGELVALSRAGYLAKDALYPHLKIFEGWVKDHENDFWFVVPGERVVGEWLAMAHGTIYKNVGNFYPFVPFDIIAGKDRVLYDEFSHRVERSGFGPANVIHDSDHPLSVSDAMYRVNIYNVVTETFGSHGSSELIEGAVWRVEREGRVDFLAKYVRPDKVDGKYLPEISGQPAIWHWKPEGME